ncbi:MAG: ABC transporter ATP-binding protein [Acidimicrobiia bacterium]
MGGEGGRSSAALALRSIDKAFFGVSANSSVDFEVEWGEVHALLGENGAGKSTLCAVAAGLYRPDGGEVRVDGRLVELRSPSDALAAGIGMVYQHFKLVANLTVAENIVLGHPDTPARLSRRSIERLTADLAARYGLGVDPSARVWQLSVGEQQRVEILKLLHREVRILILDEPTAVLTPQEALTLFDTMRVMTDEGRAVVFVSHKLDEVLSVARRITVLRDGGRVGTVDAAETTPLDLARMMVGREFSLPERRGPASPGLVVLSVRGLEVMGDRGIPAVRSVDLDLRAGEIVGVAGVAGNGQRELAEAVAGVRDADAGTITLCNRDVSRRTARGRADAGLGFIPEDRLGTGLAPGLSIADNLALRRYRSPEMSGLFAIRRPAMERYAADLVDRFDVRGSRRGLPVRLLSGGNLQKAVLAREIDHGPNVLLACAPTRGLDVGATSAVRARLLDERDRGVGILLVSEDLDELLALSDRVVVMRDGELVGEVSGEGATIDEIGLLMAGST